MYSYNGIEIVHVSIILYMGMVQRTPSSRSSSELNEVVPWTRRQGPRVNAGGTVPYALSNVISEAVKLCKPFKDKCVCVPERNGIRCDVTHS